VVGLAASPLSPLHDTPPSPQLTYYRRLVVKMERFWHLVGANLTSFKFSLFFFPFFPHISEICSVLINKVLQGFLSKTCLPLTWQSLSFAFKAVPDLPTLMDQHNTCFQNLGKLTVVQLCVVVVLGSRSIRLLYCITLCVTLITAAWWKVTVMGPCFLLH